MGWGVLEGHSVVLGGEAGDARLDLLRFSIVLQEFVLAETGRNRLHPHEDATVLLLGLLDASLAEGRHGPLLPLLALVGRKRSIASKGLHLLQLVQQLDVGLGDFRVLLVVPVGEGPAFGVFDFLVLGEAVAVEGQLVLPLLSNFLQLAQMRLVETR